MTRKKFELKATIYDKRGKVLSVGENSYSKTHPKQAELARIAGREGAIYLHAEIAAIIKLKNKQDKAHKIFIERYDSDGNPLLAKPCEICSIALEMAGIKLIEFTS